MQDVGSSDHAADIMAADSSDSDMHSKLSATLQQDSAATVAAADANDDGGLSAAEQQQGADDRQPDRSYFVDGLRVGVAARITYSSDTCTFCVTTDNMLQDKL